MPDSLDIMDAPTAASALRWWADAGVDMIADDEAVAWLDRAKQAKQPVAAAEIKPEDTRPSTLPAYVDWLKSVDIAALGPAHLRIPASGNAASGLMIIVDIPEQGDESRGSLLSGEAGLLFERMLSAIGRDRDSVYTIALSISRPATTLVAEQDMPLLKTLALHHIKLAQPKRLWLMGNATSRALLGLDAIAARGCLHEINHEGINVEAVVSFAPPFLLKNPLRKAAAWADMQALVKGMNS
jgi:DNA polymerase